LRGFTSGYAVPTYVIDAPGGGGKVPIMPDYIVGRDENDLILRNYKDEIFRYPDHSSQDAASSIFIPMTHAEA
jgi:lysine 2,3-aminomutase